MNPPEISDDPQKLAALFGNNGDSVAPVCPRARRRLTQQSNVQRRRACF
jgi:hypothetical protein